MGVLFRNLLAKSKNDVNLAWYERVARVGEARRSFFKGRLLVDPLSQKVLLKIMRGGALRCSWLE